MARRRSVALNQLAPDLDQTCGEYLTRYREEFRASIERGESGLVGPAAFAASFDGLISALHCAARAALVAKNIEPRGALAILATGSYGRRRLGLYSDLDVIFLVEDSADPYASAMVEALLYPLWDLGCEIGHLTVSIDELIGLAKEDLRVRTSLLDLHLIAGERSLVDALDERAAIEFFGGTINSLLDALEEERGERVKRFGDSPYLLEPEVKNGLGGIRDLDMIRWIARARFGASSFEEMRALELLLPAEIDALEAASEMLFRVRNLLHHRAGRRHDRLTFADQEEISVALGFVDGVVLGVEQFMQAYYRHARAVDRALKRLMDKARLRGPRSEGNRSGAFILRDETIDFEEPKRLGEEPSLALAIYRAAIRHKRRVSADAEASITEWLDDEAWKERLAHDERARALFLELLMEPSAPPFAHQSVLASLHDQGLVAAIVFEFTPLIGRVHHDIFHVFTADIHCIRAVDCFRAAIRGELPPHLGLMSRLAAETSTHRPVFVALLLHAIGRVKGGREHAATGAEMSLEIAMRLGLPPHEAEYIQMLIREQLTLYRYATSRDVHDSETLEELVTLVGTPQTLRDLLLVSMAILATTNPDALTPWKARAFEELHSVVGKQLDRGSFPPPPGFVDTLRENLLERYAREGLHGEAALIASFLSGMPDRYLLGKERASVEAHARFIAESRERPFAIRLRYDAEEGSYELLFGGEDRRGLLADLAAIVSASGFDVIHAEIYTRREKQRSHAFDIFTLIPEYPDQEKPREALLEARFNEEYARLTEREITAEELLDRRAAPRWAKRYRPEVETEVAIDNEASAHFTVVDILTHDRPRLLHDIARTFAEFRLSIVVSKLNTEGDRVIDVFYIEDEGGGRLLDPIRIDALREALLERIEPKALSDC